MKISTKEFSDLELRTLVLEGKNLVDLHTQTAMKMFKLAKEKITPEMRRKAKEFNFGRVYGNRNF